MTSIVNNDEIPLSLTQGIKFKKYQDKKTKSLEKSIENVNSVEGFTSGLQLNANGLTNEKHTGNRSRGIYWHTSCGFTTSTRALCYWG